MADSRDFLFLHHCFFSSTSLFLSLYHFLPFSLSLPLFLSFSLTLQLQFFFIALSKFHIHVNRAIQIKIQVFSEVTQKNLN